MFYKDNYNLKIFLYLLIIFIMGIVFYIFDTVQFLLFAYFFIIIDWALNIKRRFSNKHISKQLVAFSVMAVLLNALRFIKYDLFIGNTVAIRWLWYLYYVPILLMPFFMFRAALYIDKTEDETISKRWNLLYVPTLFLIFAVLTNDYHGLVFKLKPDVENWNGDYSYGVLYYCVIALVVVYILALFVLIFKRFAKPRLIKHLWLPGLVVLFAVIYLVDYIHHILNPDALKLFRDFNIPEAISILSIFFWESLVSIHLLPSNKNHYSFFIESSVKGGICDNDFKTVISNNGDAYPKETLISAFNSPVLIDESTLLKCHKISGGYFYHTVDIADINRINSELVEKKDYLNEENIMLFASNKLEEDKKSYEQQTIIYNSIAKSIKPQCDKINLLLDSASQNEEQFDKIMSQIGIIGAFIKRYTNLILLSEENESISTAELKFAIDELLIYSSLAGIDCSAEINCDTSLPCNQVLYLFELLETVIEAALPDVKKINISLCFSDGEGEYKIILEEPSAPLTNSYSKFNVNPCEIPLLTESVDNFEFVTQRINVKGGAV